MEYKTSAQGFKNRGLFLSERKISSAFREGVKKDYIPLATKKALLQKGVSFQIAVSANNGAQNAALANRSQPLPQPVNRPGPKPRTQLTGEQQDDLQQSVNSLSNTGKNSANGNGYIQVDATSQLAALRYSFLPHRADLDGLRRQGARNWLIKQLTLHDFDFGKQIFPTMAAQVRLFQTLGSALGGFTPERRQQVTDRYMAESKTYLRKVVLSSKPFLNRYFQFLENYFGVAFNVLSGDPSSWEQGMQGHSFFEEVIVANGLGSFGNLLNKVARSPAMLINLNGVDSKKGSDPLENYARELLELHTIGAVSRHYTLSNIKVFARLLTGMRFSRLTSDIANPWGQVGGEYFFSGADHDTGAKNFDFLNIAIPAYPEKPSLGDQKITQVLNALAIHPDTAKHFVTRLVQHFVSDPEWRDFNSMVDRLAKVFIDTDGDLKAVLQALVMDFMALSPAAFKSMQPFVLLVGILRSSGLITVTGGQEEEDLLGDVIYSYLPALDQPLKQPPTVQGFLPNDDIWINPAAMMQIYDTISELAVRISTKIPAGILYNNIVSSLAGIATPGYSASTGKIKLFMDSEPINAIIAIYMSPEVLKRG